MTVWVGTSWKMNKTLAEAQDYAVGLAESLPGEGLAPGVQAFVLPPFTALHAVATALAGTQVLVGAQNAHWEEAGAWTGEISVAQAADAGASIIEIGHSERRRHFAETDETVRRKVAATVQHGLVALVCVGEDEQARDAGRSADVVLGQVEAALAGLPPDRLGQVLVAYEPVWAIGDQGRPADPDELEPVFAAVRSRWGGQVRGLLYGGSVSVDNAATISRIPHVDGVFVGRAAWTVTGFLSILRAIGGPPGPPTGERMSVSTDDSHRNQTRT